MRSQDRHIEANISPLGNTSLRTIFRARQAGNDIPQLHQDNERNEPTFHPHGSTAARRKPKHRNMPETSTTRHATRQMDKDTTANERKHTRGKTTGEKYPRQPKGKLYTKSADRQKEKAEKRQTQEEEMTHSKEKHHREREAEKLAGRREQRMEAGETAQETTQRNHPIAS